MELTNRPCKTLLGGGLAILFGLALAHSSQAVAQGFWETKASMPTARNSPHVVAIGGLLYVAGGNDGVVGATTVLEAYDPLADSWTTLAPMPGRRYAGAAGVIDGKLYVAGGWNFPDSCCKTNTLQIYDPALDSWSFGTSLPNISASGAGGVIDRKLYVHDGFSNNFVVYDPDTLAWTVKTSPPNFHAGPASGVIGGKLYVAGGSVGSNVTATLDVYDPGTNTWATMTPMPTARASPFGGVLDGKLYVAGGWDGSADLNTAEVYDPTTDSWTTMTPMPTARQGAHNGISSPAIDGKLYMVGGQAGASVLATLEVFSPEVIPQLCVNFTNFCDGLEVFVSSGIVYGTWQNFDCVGSNHPGGGTVGFGTATFEAELPTSPNEALIMTFDVGARTSDLFVTDGFTLVQIDNNEPFTISQDFCPFAPGQGEVSRVDSLLATE